MLEWITLSVIKRTTLLFWAAWLSAVATTHVFDALRAIGAIPDSFKFVSGNWHWINRVMDPLGVPRGLQVTLFAGAIAWEALGATLFWWAVASYRGRPLLQEKAATAACGVNLGLWSAFQVLDEVFLAYQPEGVHRVIFVSQLATLLLLHLLPDGRRQSGTIEAHEIRAARGPVDPTPGSPRF
jgi:hypothetical protein